MATVPRLLDQFGKPIQRRMLTEEIAAATITGVRSPITGYPGDGLTPQRLAAILREADQGDPLRYLELAETAEERDLHYAGVLGKRKRQVSQLDIIVEAASEEPDDIRRADEVREWLKRDELAEELFDILDAVGKGYSFTEIIWENSERQWQPERLEWRDPRWFRFDRIDGTTPKLLDENGVETPLPGYKFIQARIRAKSGLPVRSGIARIALWAWMFKAYTLRDWAIFCQNFGQPVRIGKYGAGATKEEKNTLFRAVANIAGDLAAIIPESMGIEFIEAKGVTSNNTMFGDRADWFDRQVSKCVLGGTATTDAIAGGHAVGKEHREVEEDIERADCKSLSAVINRDLIVPWTALNHGPGVPAPRAKIGRPEQKDVKLIVESVAKLVPLGLKVGQKQMQELVGLDEPAADDELLMPASSTGPGDDPEPPPDDPDETGDIDPEALSAGRPQPALTDPADGFTKQAVAEGRSGFQSLWEAARTMARSADSLEDLRAQLEAAIDSGELAGDLADLEAVMNRAMLAAELSGRMEIGP